MDRTTIAYLSLAVLIITLLFTAIQIREMTDKRRRQYRERRARERQMATADDLSFKPVERGRADQRI